MRKNNVTVHLHCFPAYVRPLLRRAARETVAARSAGARAEITLILVSDREIRKLNRAYRRVERITDVISFRYDSDPLEGDIFIARERSKKQATQQGHSWSKELAYLIVHGVLHLFGYTDYTSAARKTMFAAQDKIFQCLFS